MAICLRSGVVFVLICVPMFCALGCSDGLLEVEGKVTFDGTPLEKGTISFEPEDGKGQTRAVPIRDGVFRFAGKETIAPGNMVVRIRATKSTGKKISAIPGGPANVDDEVQYIPQVFNDRSKLKVKMEAGKKNEFTFDLKPPS